MFNISKLLSRCDSVFFENGKLIIIPANGQPVPDKWLKENTPAIIRQILTQLDLNALQYIRFSTGKYSDFRSGGATLQFIHILDAANAYAIFNVNTLRQRSSKHGRAGTPLPNKQFSVSRSFLFYKFWLATGLSLPPRLSAFHDYMGKLSTLLFIADKVADKKERLNASSLRALSIGANEILQAFPTVSVTNTNHTNVKQLPDNGQTRLPNKTLLKIDKNHDVTRPSTTGDIYHGTSNQGSAGQGDNTTLSSTYPNPEGQTNEEWLARNNS